MVLYGIRELVSIIKISNISLPRRVDHTANKTGRLADGRKRVVTTYNGKLPGPLLVVCQNDIVKVQSRSTIIGLI